MDPAEAWGQHLSPVRPTPCTQNSSRRPFLHQRSQVHRCSHGYQVRDGERLCLRIHMYVGWVGWVFFSLPFSPQVNLAKLVITARDKAFKYLDTSQPNGIKTENFQANFPGRSRTAARSANEKRTCQGEIL